MSTSVRDGGAARDTKHGRLRRFLRDRIQSGEYSEGQFLPSEPALAQQFDISRHTVRQALSELQNDGLVERIPGRGTLVCPLGGQPAETPQPRPQPASLTVFALVLPEIRYGHYPALVNSFDEAAGDLHHQVLVCTTGNDIRKQGDVVLQLIDKRVAGVALSPPTIGTSPVHQLRQLHEHQIPVVLLHRAVAGFAAPVVAISHEKIAKMAAKAIIEQGHQRVALILSHRSPSGERYEQGFTAALAEGGCPTNPELIHYGQSPLGTTGELTPGRAAELDETVRQMLALPEDRRPTAAFVLWDAEAEAVYFSLMQQGVRVPDQFSLVSFGGTCRSGVLGHRLTVVAVDERDFALRTASLLDGMCRGVEPLDSGRQYEVRLSFFSGSTLGPAR